MFVQCIPQESTNSCWAAAMAMLLQALSGNSRRSAARPASPFDTSWTPRDVAERAGLSAVYEHNGMIASLRRSFTQLAAPWGLTVVSNPSNPSPSEWDRIINRVGPVLINLDLVRHHHTIIVSGINRNQLTIVDPWPVRRGSRYQRDVSTIAGPIHTMIHGPATRTILQPRRGGG